MSILNKLTVGALAVLGAYALKGKRRETGAPDEGHETAKRGKTPRAASKAKAASHSTARTAKRATASRATPRKRAHRSASAKRTRTT